MTEQDRERFAAVMMAIAEEYGMELSEATVQVWWRALQAYSIDEIEHAYWTYLADPEKSRFRPHPGELIGIIRGSNEAAALRAWSAVERAIRHVGPWQSVVFDDLLIHAVIADMGGWPVVCSTSDTELPFRRKEFETRYRAYITTPPTTYPRILEGLSDMGNAAAGHARRQIAFIGDPHLCELVLRTGAASASLPVRRITTEGLPAPADALLLSDGSATRRMIS